MLFIRCLIVFASIAGVSECCKAATVCKSAPAKAAIDEASDPQTRGVGSPLVTLGSPSTALFETTLLNAYLESSPNRWQGVLRRQWLLDRTSGLSPPASSRVS